MNFVQGCIICNSGVILEFFKKATWLHLKKLDIHLKKLDIFLEHLSDPPNKSKTLWIWATIKLSSQNSQKKNPQFVLFYIYFKIVEIFFRTPISLP